MAGTSEKAGRASPKIRKVAFFVNPARPGAVDAARELISWCESQDLEVRLPGESARAMDRLDLLAGNNDAGDVDLVVVLGGDGIMWQEMDMAGSKQVVKVKLDTVLSNIVAMTGEDIDPVKAIDPTQKWIVNKQFYDYVAAGTKTLHDQPMYVLEGTWKQTTLTNSQMAAVTAMVGKTTLYIGEQDGFVHKIEPSGRFPKRPFR